MRNSKQRSSTNWWKSAVFYQIYPRSFCDSTGDGIGDLRGIISKLDYLKSLNIDALWISPFFKSPMDDFGYDVSDYREVDPIFGSNDDFDELLAEAHKRDIKIVIDLVLSHTSDQHPWFTDKPEYYVWSDGVAEEDDNKHGQSIFSADEAQATTSGHSYFRSEATKSVGKRRRPPNNWVSVFGGSAWEYHEERQQYYLHNFLKSQPDLNFHNADVRRECLDIARFWLDRGVDGFRLDVINFCTHDAELRDNPPRDAALGSATQFEGDDPYSAQAHIYDKSRPENLAFIEDFRTLMDEYPDTVTIGEIGDDNPYERAVEYTAGSARLHTCYNPQMMGGIHKTLTMDIIRTPIEEFLKLNDGHPAWAFSNHDVVRAASRWLANSDGFSHDPKLSKMLIALLGCLHGTLFIYQGEELGLPEVKLEFADLQDPWGKHLYPKWQGRDGCRTPMPWSADKPTKSWLPMPDSHIEMNVNAQKIDPNSTLNFTREFLKWRKTRLALINGDINFKDHGEHVLEFTRSCDAQTLECRFDLQSYDYEITPLKP